MNLEDTALGLQQEFRRGTLIMLVLSQLKQPAYGYHLVKRLNDHQIPMEANTLYPLMRRLETQGLLKSQWDTTEAKPRKYYVITEDGQQVLDKVKNYWREFTDNVNSLLEEE